MIGKIYNKIIMYDDKNMQYLTGYLANIETEYETTVENTIEGQKTKIIPIWTNVAGRIDDPDVSQTIELDETLMKRIAKYNKEAEIEKYNETIKEKKKKIKELDDILKDKEKRVEKIKKFVAEIYDIDIEDEEEDYF